VTFVGGLPKAELHVHHVGSAPIRTVAELAARHEGSTVVPSDPDKLAEYYDFTGFAHFIDVYLSVVDLLRTAEDIWTLTHDVAHDLAAQNVRYAELTLTPYTSIRAGLAAEAFCEAVEDARRVAESELDLTLRWCFDIPGEFGIVGAEATIDTALKQQPDGLVSFGLGGPEAGVPRSKFAPYFAQAQAAGLHSVPHAGESTGPETIWDALRLLGAERIGHGIAAVLDPKLMEYLAATGVVLEVCPTSNVRTKSVLSLAAHPLPALVEAGVPVTINSDDPPMFDTTLNQEYEVARELLGLDDEGVADLARTAVRASFADEPVKSAILAEIDAYAGVSSASAPA